jgi:ABC-type hemin transport system ATPase subunit
MATKGYKVCWWFVGRPRKTCRVLSSKQHRNGREAAETVLMQNPGALVQVVSPRGGGRGTVFRKQSGKTVCMSAGASRLSQEFEF